eukprot:jgi/Orpsp1_1/1182716/evm.model.c7180000082382.1
MLYSGNSDLITPIVAEFNNFSKENNLDIEFSVEVFTTDNTTLAALGYESTIDYLLEKHSKKYDIIYYDVMYSPKYSPYFIDLSQYLSEDHIKMYSSGVAPDLCVYNGKWVGLTYNIDYNALYCNIDLLNKYEKDIPTTWDELIKTGKYILNKEQENGNINLVGYNGLFPDSETLLISMVEFIYTFRKTKNSEYPKYNSKEALIALKKLKEIKNELASDDIFHSNEGQSVFDMISGNSIFTKFWYSHNNFPTYKKIPLIGYKKGISGSVIGGLNIGINKFISKDNINAAVKVVEFMTSMEIQKKLIMEYRSITAIQSLYKDEEVCKVVDCDLLNSIQPVTRPYTNLWMIYFTGLIVTFGYILTYYDDITIFKCKIRIILLSFGYTLIFTPILFSLI